MRKFVFKYFILAFLIVVNPAFSDGAKAQAKSENDIGQLSKKEASYLKKIAALSNTEKRRVLEVFATRGETRLIELAIRVGLVSPDTKHQYTLLSAAAENGHLATVKMLVEQGANLELKNRLNDTPLKVAAREGHLGIVQYLLLSGANPNREGKGGTSPLTSATFAGHKDIIDVLLLNGATIKSNESRWTLLHYAAKYGHSELIEFYINKGVDIDQRSRKGWTALTLAAEAGHVEAVSTLVSHNADVNSLTNKKSSPLKLASSKGYLDVVTILTQNGSHVDQEDEDTRNALWWAAVKGQHRVIKLLLQEGANASSTVFLLAKAGKLQALEALIDSGMSLNITNEEGRTGLHIAARYGHLDVVKLYLKQGLDIHTTDNKGYIALHRAAAYGKTQIARYLLEQGSDADWTGQPNRWTPVSLAARYGHLDILQMLHQRGADLNHLTNKGWSPLMLAARGKNTSEVQYLLANKVDTEIQNMNQQTAIDIALKNKKPAVLKLLSAEALEH